MLYGTLLALGLSPLVATWTGQAYLVNLFSRVAIFGLAALSLNLILGYGGLVSFGHAAFVGVGAYVAGILSFHWFDETPILGWTPPNEALVVWPLSMLVSAIFALLIGVISLRTRGIYFIMITLAFAQMLYYFAVGLEPYGGDDGLSLWWGRNTFAGIELSNRLAFFYLCFALLSLFVLLLGRLVRSPFGRVLQGFRENELRMRALGYRPLPYQLTAFCLAGAVAGLAGAMLANLSEFVSPAFMHWSRSGQLLVMVILGGMHSLAGPIVGAAAFLLLEEVLSSYTEHWQIVFGPLLVLIVLFARGGLAGLLGGEDA